jgi:hypothetical protein
METIGRISREVLSDFQREHGLRPGWLTSMEFTRVIMSALGPRGMSSMPRDFRERLDSRLERLAEGKGLTTTSTTTTSTTTSTSTAATGRLRSRVEIGAQRRTTEERATTVSTTTATTSTAAGRKATGPAGLTAEAEERARAYARMVGADEDFLVLALRRTPVEVSRNSEGLVSVVTRPGDVPELRIDPADPRQHEKSRALTLAHHILSEAHGFGRSWEDRPRTRDGRSVADLSETNMHAGAIDYIHFYPIVIDEDVRMRRGPGYGATRALMTGEAGRLGTSRYELETAVLRYTALREVSPGLADRYLNETIPRSATSGGDFARSVRVLSSYMRSERTREGRTAYYIPPLRLRDARRDLRATDLFATRV